MRFAYADPPYIGQAKRHYADDPRCAEVDHAALISQLEQYDGWALSAGANMESLKTIIPLCPDDARVCVWVKPFASFKPGVGVAYAWEPIVIRGARARARTQDTVRDWVSANITLQRGVHGAKPDAFCYWLFEVLNLETTDELIDLYTGSGAVSRAWERWRRGDVVRVDGSYAELFEVMT